MAKFRKRSRISADMVGESSMSDVAFLLLIFFIVSTSFPEIGLPMILPSKAGDVQQVKRDNVMQIVTARSGAYFIDIDTEPTPLSELRDIVRQRLMDNENLILSLETHPDAPYGSMINALDEVTLAYDELSAANIKREHRISLKMLEIE
ncbi:MAG: biopolymer transporter ExbD [Candidatus Eisenbacteria sp.]|nr:biopolymer transporter ExbD [Candidatus Eisenbacteria bacterium]